MEVRDEGRRLRKERVFRERSTAIDQLHVTDRELIERYRFPRHSILDITDTIRQDIEHPTSRSYDIPAHIQVKNIEPYLCLSVIKRIRP